MNSKKTLNGKFKKLITLLLLIGSLASLFIDRGYPQSRDSAIITMITFNKNNETHYFNLIEFSTAAEKERGLMFRTSIQDNEGGLFIFPHEQDLHFWMYNTFITLDIIYLDSDKRVVHLMENVPPHVRLLPDSLAPVSQYVLELKGGTIFKFDIEIGSTFEF